MKREDILDRFLIRQYMEGDFPRISSLWHLTNLSNPVRGDNEKTIHDSIALGGTLLVLEEKRTGNVSGTSWMTFDGRRIHLHHFGIHPDLQKQGLARFLLKESLDFAKRKGYQVKLEVNHENKRAIDLYRKAGFSYLGDYDVYIIREISGIEPDNIF